MPTTYAIPNGRTVFDATTYTANGGVQTVDNSDLGTTGFQPDLAILKNRNSVGGWATIDSVRGTSLYLQTYLTNAEATDAQLITSFNTNGYSLGTNQFSNGTTMVGYQWKAGGTAVSNTSGSITSSVSANTTAGFSVVTWTGNSTIATIGHGLGVAPSMYIVKNRGTGGWVVYHVSLGATQYLTLQTTDAVGTSSGPWNNVAPTSSVFTVGSSFQNTSNYVAYCWAQVAGFSQFGSYTGNGSADGPFIYTGFRPKFLMVKKTDAVGNWVIDDSTRNANNIVDLELYPSLSNAEDSDPSYDFLSNGFKLRATSSNKNTNGGSYIYAAFAENPFKYANAR
jgi:hypothetical protein